MSKERNYTEKDAAKILRIAAEITRRETEPDLGGDGVSLDELARIGGEAGFDPKAIRLAAERMDDDEEVQTRWLGAPPMYEIERIIDGPLTDDVWDAIVGELNDHFAQSVSGVSSGKTRTWNFKQDTVTTHLTAHQTGKRTRLTLKRNIDDGIVVAMIPSIVLMLFAFFGPFGWTALRPWGSLLLGIVFAATIALTFRTTVAGWYRKDRRQTGRLMDKLVLTADSVYEETSGSILKPNLATESALDPVAEESESIQSRLDAT